MPPNPATPTNLPHNDGAGYDNSDAEIPLTQSDEEGEERLKQKRKRVVAEYELVKRWVTGEREVLPEEDIKRELFEEALLSGIKNTSRRIQISNGAADKLGLQFKFSMHRTMLLLVVK